MEKTMEKEMDTTVRRVIQGTYCSEYTCITEYSTKKKQCCMGFRVWANLLVAWRQ